MTFTIEQQNKFLSLVTTFGSRRQGRQIDKAPNSTNAWTLAEIYMIRSNCLIVIFAFLSSCGNKQNKLPISNWFFGASIDNSSKQNQKVLSTNIKIKLANSAAMPILNNTDTNFFFAGRSEKDLLHGKFEIDSAIIISSVGENFGYVDRKNKAPVQVLLAEYYSINQFVMDSLFEMAKNEYGLNSPSHDNNSVLITNNGEGRSFEVKYSDDKSSYHVVRVSIFKDSNSPIIKLGITEEQTYK